jgi:GH15 family glucan-1,4-alpha-glucosidase
VEWLSFPISGAVAGSGSARRSGTLWYATPGVSGALTQYVGSTALDASNLMMAIVGFLPATDPRMLITIAAIEERLTDDRGLVHRYRTDDGVDGAAGEEGTFLLCTFWLAEALAPADQVDRARNVFERAAGFANDLDLLSEEVDPETGDGNFPRPSATSISSTPPGRCSSTMSAVSVELG